MDLSSLLKQSQGLVRDNSPAILTAIGVTGVITTAYLTGKAALKYDRIIQTEEAGYERPLDFKEKARLTWIVWATPVASGVLTISAIVLANRIGSKRTAAMASALAITDKAYSEYKEKVVEKLGKNKEKTVRDALAQDRVDRKPISKEQVIVTGGGRVLFMDAWSGRYFESDMETVKKAQNDTNYQIINHDSASLSDLYDRLGLNHTKDSDNIGWNMFNQLELTFSTTMTEDDRPCAVVDFANAPAPNFYKAWSGGV
jgi:hypothetical protein